MRVDEFFFADLDELRRREEGPLPTQKEMVMRLIARALAAGIEKKNRKITKMLL